mmetsp:Transcript_33611/g.82645  ORF Transcript_33611/g.82645 Transcript_33611/m.82645 type:complete len:246 (+) Transcript_33611:73-810(+)
MGRPGISRLSRMGQAGTGSAANEERALQREGAGRRRGAGRSAGAWAIQDQLRPKFRLLASRRETCLRHIFEEPTGGPCCLLGRLLAIAMEKPITHMDFPPAVYTLHSDGILRKKGGLHEIREAQKQASGSAKWVRVYDKGVPGVSVGDNRSGLLQQTKALLKQASGAGVQPRSRTFGEDPPPQKSAQETLQATADHVFGKPSGPEPERKFSQTPAELLSKSVEVGFSSACARAWVYCRDGETEGA